MSRLTIKRELKRLNPKNPVHILALGFGAGLSPIMPGTVGTFAAIPLYLIMNQLSLLTYLFFIVGGFIIGVYVCQQVANTLGVNDHGGIVWDEFIGFFITMIAAPPGWGWLLLGFVLFRLFDIIKPQPIKWVDNHIKGGIGVMLDDVIAGLMALGVMQTIVYLSNHG